MTMNITHWSSRAFVFTSVLTMAGHAFAYACPQTNPLPAADETYQGFLGRVYEENEQKLPYRLFVPNGYDPGTSYPLVLYLHHAGLAGKDSHNESGWDNCVQLTSEIGSGDDYGGVFTHQAVDEAGKRFDTQARYPHFVLAPHAESPAYGFGGGGEGSASGPVHPTRALLKGILADVLAEFSIDPARLYVTGVSMGCYGTWDFIMRDPSVFAAASPQSCRGDPDTKLLAGLKDLPIWSICGTKDSYYAGARAMADGMKQVGATAFKFTAMEGVGHSVNDRGYDYPGFIDWMFAQRRTDVPSSGGGGAGGTTTDGSSGAAAAGAGGAVGGAGGTGMPSAGAPVSGGVASGGGGGVATSGGGVAESSGAGAANVSGAATAGAPLAENAEAASPGCSSAGASQPASSSTAWCALVLLGSVAWRRRGGSR